MAFVVLVVEIPSKDIPELNAKLQRPTKPHQAVNQAIDLLAGLSGGTPNGAMQVTVRDSDPSVSTSGSGSTQQSYNLK